MIVVVAGLIIRNGRLLIARRPDGKHMAGKWEFPGGKLERGETPEEALERELSEELGVTAKTDRVYHVVSHSYAEKDVLLIAYQCRLISGEPKPIEEAEVRWIEENDLTAFEWAEADIPIVERLKADGFGKRCDS